MDADSHFASTIAAVNDAATAVKAHEASGKAAAAKRARIALDKALAVYRSAREAALARDLAERGLPPAAPALDRAAN